MGEWIVNGVFFFNNGLGYRSWQYVNSMICRVIVGAGVMGCLLWLGAPIMHKISDLRLLRH